ncbi:protein gamete expressed 1 [Fagus crenata]
MGQYKYLLFLLVLLSLSNSGLSWPWFSSYSKKLFSEDPPETPGIFGDVVAEFSMDALNDEKGIERVNNARTKLSGLKSCWYDAYQGFFSKCSEINADDNEGKKRFAWELSNCFQKDSGRTPFPSWHTSSPLKACLEKLDNNAIHTYRQFYLETNSICHQLQLQTEKLVNQLVKSANYAEEKLETIEDKAEHLLQGSKDVHDSLTKIDHQTLQVAQTSKNVSNQINGVLKQSELVFEQSEKIAASQSELQKGQENMNIKLEEGMTMIHEYHNNLGMEIHNLQSENSEIEKKISKVEMQSLQGLQLLAKFQSQAVEESRGILQQLAKFGHEQQDKLLQRQQQLQQAHDHLVENSKSILEAQEAFEQKQATMDFERLNYDMLQDLSNKVKSWDTDGDVDWSQWIDTEIPDGIDNLKDPDSIPPEEEDTGENSNVTSSATRNTIFVAAVIDLF